MTKPHELSFGQLDPPKPRGGYAIRDGLALVPRYTESRKMKVIPMQMVTDGRVTGWARLEPGVDWKGIPALERLKKSR